MNNIDICRELNISDKQLYASCNKPRGSMYAWVLREIMLHEYNRMPMEYRTQVLQLMENAIADGVKVCKGKARGLVDGSMVMKDPYIHNLFVIYSRYNPYGEMVCL